VTTTDIKKVEGLTSDTPIVPSSEHTDDRIQRRSTVRLGIRLIHKICPEINLSNNEPSSTQQPTVPRSLRLRLSPKARKLIKQTSLIIQGSNSSTNNSSNGNVKSIVEADVVDGLNRVSKGKKNERVRAYDGSLRTSFAANLG
jgi:hypothetical protein